MKKLVCILNHGDRSADKTFESFVSFQDEYEKFDIKIFSEQVRTSTDFIWYDPSWNQAKAYNSMLRYAKSQSYDICIIVDDDVIMTQKEGIYKYLQLMSKIDVGFMFFGYNNANNLKSLGDRPNPTVDVRITDDEHVLLDRHTCTGVMFFDLAKLKDVMFDERLNVLFLDDFIDRCYKEQIIPFNGLYFDISDAWKYFARIPGAATIRKVTQTDYKADAALLENEKRKFDLSVVIDPYLNYLCEKFYNVKIEYKKKEEV